MHTGSWCLVGAHAWLCRLKHALSEAAALDAQRMRLWAIRLYLPLFVKRLKFIRWHSFHWLGLEEGWRLQIVHRLIQQLTLETICGEKPSTLLCRGAIFFNFKATFSLLEISLVLPLLLKKGHFSRPIWRITFELIVCCDIAGNLNLWLQFSFKASNLTLIWFSCLILSLFTC